MELRTGLMGDMEKPSAQWKLPERNWPLLEDDADTFAKARPPVESSEIDFVIQIRARTTICRTGCRNRTSGEARKGSPLLAYH